MSGDVVGSGESFHDDRPDTPPPEPSPTPEYADPVEDLGAAGAEDDSDSTDGNLDDFEPEEEPVDEVDQPDEDAADWREPEERRVPVESRPAREDEEVSDGVLDEADDVAARARQDTDRRAEPESGVQTRRSEPETDEAHETRDNEADARDTDERALDQQRTTKPRAVDDEKEDAPKRDERSADTDAGDKDKTTNDRDDEGEVAESEGEQPGAEDGKDTDTSDTDFEPETQADDEPAEEHDTGTEDHGTVFDDIRRAHAEAMDEVRRANETVQEMIADANREIKELIRTGEIHNLPDLTDELEIPETDIEDVEIPDVEWDRPGTDTDREDTPDAWPYLEGRRPAPEGWQEWEEDADQRTPDDHQVPDYDWGQPDSDEQVDWSRQVDIPDEFEGIPYLTREAVEARTQASLEHSQELVTQPEPILARDYSQEIKPIEEMEPGGVIHMGPTQMHILKAGDVETFATEWHAHVERQEAARYSHDYAKDARPLSSQGMHDLARHTLASEHEGRHYFQEAIPAVANGRCDPDQLRTVLNELHPEMREKYGFFQPAGWRNLPYVKDSALQPKPTRQYNQAKQAVEGYVRSLPDGDRYGKEDTPNNAAAMRLRAEIDLYLRTRDATAPRAIREARLHRLASTLEQPKVWYDQMQRPRVGALRQLPKELRELYHNARAADPMARIFRIYR